MMKKLFACLLALSLLCGTSLAENKKKEENVVTISAEEYESLKKYEKLEQVLEVIDAAYLWEYEIDDLLQGAAQGMIGALGDDYSYYYTEADVVETQESITGEYGGLGFEVFANANDLTITIRRVFHGSPAQQCGLRANDKIIAVNGEEMTAYDLDYAVSLMRGEVGGEVTLTILRADEIFEVTAKRAIVEMEIIDSEILPENIGYVRLYYFEGGLDEQFREALKTFRAEDVKGVIIDLRSNTGGLADLAVAVADCFLDEELVFYSVDKYGRRLDYYAEEGGWDIPLAVLINGSSASASEIVAAALRDSADAVMVGTKSFGKGIMQMIYTFPDGVSGMQTTSEYWHAPSGVCVHGEGIEPDIAVELGEDAYDENYNIIREKDAQLQAAVEAVLKMAGEQAAE